MTKGLLVSVAVLALSTSAALAAHRTHHRDAMNAFAAVPAPPVGWIGGVNSSDRAMYLRNLRDSGYNPKNNINAAGTSQLNSVRSRRPSSSSMGGLIRRTGG